MKISRKKIRGYKRKLIQIEEWKQNVINYPFDSIGNTKRLVSFKFNAISFYYLNSLNPPKNICIEIYKAFFEISKKLNQNQLLKDRNLCFQVWIYYPNSLYSNIRIASQNKIAEIEKAIEAVESNNNPPKFITEIFLNFKWKCGRDIFFTSQNPQSENAKWSKNYRGDIWIPNLVNK